MKCPVDGTTLHLAERAGLEIDYCPDCRGIWLDRGELDKLIERGNVSTAPPPPPSAAAAPRAGDNSAPGGPPAPTAAASDRPPSVQSAAMDALRAVRELADAHKRKGSGFRGF